MTNDEVCATSSGHTWYYIWLHNPHDHLIHEIIIPILLSDSAQTCSYLSDTAHSCLTPVHTCLILHIPVSYLFIPVRYSSYLSYTCSYLSNTAHTCLIPVHTCLILLIPVSHLFIFVWYCTYTYLSHTCSCLSDTAHTYTCLTPVHTCSYLFHISNTYSYMSHTCSHLLIPVSLFHTHSSLIHNPYTLWGYSYKTHFSHLFLSLPPL